MNEKEIFCTILDIIQKDKKSGLFRLPAIRAFINPEDKEIYNSKSKNPEISDIMLKN